MNQIGEALQRVWPCVSMTAHPRSAAHATNFQLFTLPRGNPEEDRIEPRGPLSIRLGALHHGQHHSSAERKPYAKPPVASCFVAQFLLGKMPEPDGRS